VAAFIFGFAVMVVPREQIGLLSRQNLVWLGLSGATTAVSWVFYYKALEEGEVSTVALIDKGSFIVALVLAWLFLGEQMTHRIVMGALLILAGLVVVSRR
jgi:transporter family protein